MNYDAHARAVGIGASDIPQILGLSPYAGSGPWAVALRKRYPELGSESADSIQQALGRAAEPVLVEHAGGKPNSEIFWKAWQYATPDGLLPDGSPVEAKLVGAHNASHWFVTGACYPPDYVWAQAQWQAATLDAARCTVVAYVAGCVSVFTQRADIAFARLALSAASSFRDAAFEGKVSLPCDSTEACRKLLKLAAPAPPAEATPSTLGQRLAWYAYDSARAAAKAAEGAKQLAYAELLSVAPQGHTFTIPEGELTMHTGGAKLRKVRAPRPVKL